MNSKQKGNAGEKFVAEKLKELGFLTETHPRTFRIIHVNGRQIQVSQDNDYYNLFDVKAEKQEYMIYAQVKVEKEKIHTSTAQKDIDRLFPYEFAYQSIQTWQLWKEWVPKPRRHTEFFFRIQERRGFTDRFWGKTEIRKGNWVEINLEEF